MSGGRNLYEQHDRLVIATGARPQRPNLSGENARNVFLSGRSMVQSRCVPYIDNERPQLKARLSSVAAGVGVEGWGYEARIGWM